jgi:hypothetical protein
MKDHTINPETLRKRNSKNNETDEQREARLKRDRERKRKRKAEETDEDRDARLTSIREQKKQRNSMETSAECKNRLNREKERKRIVRNRKNQRNQEEVEERQEIAEERQQTADETNVRPRSAQTISEDEHKMLQNFRNKMDKIRYNFCPVCNERIPLMSLVKGMCR